MRSPPGQICDALGHAFAGSIRAPWRASSLRSNLTYPAPVYGPGLCVPSQVVL